MSLKAKAKYSQVNASKLLFLFLILLRLSPNSKQFLGETSDINVSKPDHSYRF